MLLVCLSHFTSVYFRAEYQSGGRVLPAQIGMLASPTFMAVSGMMVGLMSVVYSRGFNKLRIKLIDRALFLLTVGHVLVVMARFFEPPELTALRTTVITDAVGVSVLIGVWLVRLTRPRTRILLGVGLFAAAWLLVYGWQPIGTWSSVAKEVLVGALPNRVMWYTVPLLQWLGVYLVCSALGQHLGWLYLRDDRRGVERTFAMIAVASVVVAVTLRVISWGFRPPIPPGGSWLYEPIFSPWSKEVPSPVYVLFMGGLGMALVWLVVCISHRRLGARLLIGVTRIGRSSLAVFILQQYIYYALLDTLSLPRSRAWPLFFLISLIPIFAFAGVWDKRQLNTTLTVGLRSYFQKRADRSKAAQPASALETAARS